MDEDLKYIRKVQRYGDESSANYLIQTYYKQIFSYTYTQLKDKELAMDLTQEIFVKMLKSIHLFDSKKGIFRTWLYQIAKYSCIDYFRSKAYKSKILIEYREIDEITFNQTIEEEYLVEEQLADVEKVLLNLYEPEKTIVTEKLIGNKSFQYIAEQVKLPLSTVKTKYYKSLRFIKKQVEVVEND